jgi:hypothetical protein
LQISALAATDVPLLFRMLAVLTRKTCKSDFSFSLSEFAVAAWFSSGVSLWYLLLYGVLLFEQS